jgi:hypothetical protein
MERIIPQALVAKEAPAIVQVKSLGMNRDEIAAHRYDGLASAPEVRFMSIADEQSIA